jgi:hypothetical protein
VHECAVLDGDFPWKVSTKIRYTDFPLSPLHLDVTTPCKKVKIRKLEDIDNFFTKI